MGDPIEQMRNVPPVIGDAGDGNPVGLTSAGAFTLGEGAGVPTTGVGSADATAGDQTDAYLAMIRARVEQHRKYPSAARRRREEGMAELRITIDGQGQLRHMDVIISSGSFHLDRTAKRMIEKSGPFPLPPVVPFATTIPIVFELR
ncbi:MAG: TonB family protein [Parvibaculum sp.]